MTQIERLASLVVWRGFGFSWLAIAMAMSGLVFDLSLACRIGSLMALVVALIFEMKAATYHRIKRISECEVWIMLADDARPPIEIARRIIVPAMRDQLREKALYSAVMGGGLFVISLMLRIFLPG
ncbi:MAG TPA: hypothetical protein VLA52_05720 [Thermohalobaculum sp.]|nr:hypothetical protein [Thermohalobaculum sp.]